MTQKPHAAAWAALLLYRFAPGALRSSLLILAAFDVAEAHPEWNVHGLAVGPINKNIPAMVAIIGCLAGLDNDRRCNRSRLAGPERDCVGGQVELQRIVG